MAFFGARSGSECAWVAECRAFDVASVDALGNPRLKGGQQKPFQEALEQACSHVGLVLEEKIEGLRASSRVNRGKRWASAHSPPAPRRALHLACAFSRATVRDTAMVAGATAPWGCNRPNWTRLHPYSVTLSLYWSCLVTHSAPCSLALHVTPREWPDRARTASSTSQRREFCLGCPTATSIVLIVW